MRIPCMIVLMCCFVIAPSAWLVSQTSDQSGGPLKVYVTARVVEPVDSATKKQLQKELKEKASQAKEHRKSLEKQLKGQLGGDKDKWPPEKQEELKQAEDVERMILMDLESLNIEQKDLTDTAEDIKRSIAGEGLAKVKQWIRLVETREEADLTAEVTCRRREGIPGLIACADCWYYVYVKISPQAGINAENLGQVSPKGGFGKYIRRIHQYSDQEPFWIMEASDQGRWGNAANQAAGALNRFIEEHLSVLKTREKS